MYPISASEAMREKELRRGDGGAGPFDIDEAGDDTNGEDSITGGRSGGRTGAGAALRACPAGAVPEMGGASGAALAAADGKAADAPAVEAGDNGVTCAM